MSKQGELLLVFYSAVFRGRTFGSLTLLLLTSILQPTPTWAQSTPDLSVQKLTASDGIEDDRFGFSVAIDDRTAVLGAPKRLFSTSGSAYVFRWDTESFRWREEAQLFPDESEPFGQFGHSVSISGLRIVVGDRRDRCSDGSINCGAVFVYRYDTSAHSWLQEAKLAPSDPSVDKFFGVSVSTSGSILVVGASGSDCPGGRSCGAAYIFRFDPTASEWLQEAKLQPSDLETLDDFGIAVSTNGSQVIVGNRSDNCLPSFGCGAAYIFRHDPELPGWVQEAKLVDPHGGPEDQFGISVAISGTTAVVGAINTDCDDGNGCGAAFVYKYETSSRLWNPEAVLLGSDTEKYDSFGRSVALDNDLLVVGADRDDDAGDKTGSAYIFRFNRDTGTWIQDKKLLASDASAGSLFGYSVAVSHEVILVGAQRTDCLVGPDCGAAYIFQPSDVLVPASSVWGFITFALLFVVGTEILFGSRSVVCTSAVERLDQMASGSVSTCAISPQRTPS